VSGGLVLQTQANCPPGLLCDWAGAHRLELDVLRVDRWSDLPDPSGYSFGVALGSQASLVGASPEWVTGEIDWIRRADSAGVPVLGICFGAQALAVALGGSVRRLATPEYAWTQLSTRDTGRVPSGPWLALHEDRIGLPPLGDELARNDFGPQAFGVGAHLGVQFHPEATPAMLRRWIVDREDVPAEVGAELIAGTERHSRPAAAAALDLFDGFALRAGLGSTTVLSTRS
jgi:GMP synthase-like glutamine amidotransferase